MNATNFSVFIPHMFPNIPKERIANAFESNQLGLVKKIDLVSHIDKQGKKYNCAFIHFSHWYMSESAMRFLKRVEDPSKEARLVYDDPWFWIVLPNTGTRVLPGDRKKCLEISMVNDEVSPLFTLVDSTYAEMLEDKNAVLYKENQIMKKEMIELRNQISGMKECMLGQHFTSDSQISELGQHFTSDFTQGVSCIGISGIGIKNTLKI
jgi:hypothetical protein